MDGIPIRPADEVMVGFRRFGSDSDDVLLKQSYRCSYALSFGHVGESDLSLLPPCRVQGVDTVENRAVPIEKGADFAGAPSGEYPLRVERIIAGDGHREVVAGELGGVNHAIDDVVHLMPGSVLHGGHQLHVSVHGEFISRTENLPFSVNEPSVEHLLAGLIGWSHVSDGGLHPMAVGFGGVQDGPVDVEVCHGVDVFIQWNPYSIDGVALESPYLASDRMEDLVRILPLDPSDAAVVLRVGDRDVLAAPVARDAGACNRVLRGWGAPCLVC